MNSTTNITNITTENISSYGFIIFYLFLVITFSSFAFILCFCIIKRILSDIKKNTLRVSNKQIPMSHKSSEKTCFQTTPAAILNEENYTTGANEVRNESLDIKKMQEELYEKEEKMKKQEFISEIEIDFSKI